MLNLSKAYLSNIVRANLTKDLVLDPMIATLYVTNLCNFRCTYCEDFSADKNHLYKDRELSTEDMKRVITIIKKSMDVLYITGGEPLVRDDIEELLKHAVDVGFPYVAMNTNGSLLPRKEKVIDYLNNLVISLDSLNAEKYDPILGMKKGTAQKVIDTIKRYAPEQKKRNFTMTINCVVTPETISDAIEVMDFCWEHEIYYTAQPQNVGESVHPKLRNNPEYQALVQRVIDGKNAGKTVSGSRVYFEQMRDLSRHQCYPTLAPHIDPQGNLWYPCRPIAAVSTNLLEVGSYEEALRRGKEIYGNPPEGCDRCRMRCYAELSTLVKNPHRMAEETTRYLVSTFGKVLDRHSGATSTGQDELARSAS